MGNGEALLDELLAHLLRYVIFPNVESAYAAALWIAASHAQPAWEHAPRLAVISPEKRCGKSRLMDVAAETVYRPFITINASPAAIYRSMPEQDPPTMLVDEADTIFGKKASDAHEDLRALLNAGHQRNRPAVRFDMTTRRVEEFPCFAFAMLAGIGDLPDTIMDRSVIIRMRRRKDGEAVQPFRTRRDSPPLRDLARRLSEWLRSELRALTAAVPSMPVEDREADTWEPLFAVADLAGGPWPSYARQSVQTIGNGHEAVEQIESLPLRLLSDMRDIWAELEDLPSATIIDRLMRVEESPWENYYGRKFTPTDLSNKLKPYGIKSHRMRIGDNQVRGYRKADLQEAWDRYLPTPTLSPPQDSRHSVTDEAATIAPTQEQLDLQDVTTPSQTVSQQPSQPSRFDMDGSEVPEPPDYLDDPEHMDLPEYEEDRPPRWWEH